MCFASYHQRRHLLLVKVTHELLGTIKGCNAELGMLREQLTQVPHTALVEPLDIVRVGGRDHLDQFVH